MALSSTEGHVRFVEANVRERSSEGGVGGGGVGVASGASGGGVLASVASGGGVSPSEASLPPVGPASSRRRRRIASISYLRVTQ